MDYIKATYNPCKIENGKCRGYGLGINHDFCCGGCKYLTKEGCSTKSPWCKLWFCDTYWREYLPKNIVKEIDHFKRVLSYAAPHYLGRHSIEDMLKKTLNDLYYNENLINNLYKKAKKYCKENQNVRRTKTSIRENQEIIRNLKG